MTKESGGSSEIAREETEQHGSGQEPFPSEGTTIVKSPWAEPSFLATLFGTIAAMIIALFGAYHLGKSNGRELALREAELSARESKLELDELGQKHRLELEQAREQARISLLENPLFRRQNVQSYICQVELARCQGTVPPPLPPTLRTEDLPPGFKVPEQ